MTGHKNDVGSTLGFLPPEAGVEAERCSCAVLFFPEVYKGMIMPTSFLSGFLFIDIKLFKGKCVYLLHSEAK